MEGRAGDRGHIFYEGAWTCDVKGVEEEWEEEDESDVFNEVLRP